MDDIFHRRHIYAEGWTGHELEIYSKRARQAAFLSIAISLALIACPLILITSYSQTITWMIIIYSVLSLALGILVILWTKGFRSEVVNDDHLGAVETVEYNKQQSTMVLILSFFMILISGLLTIMIAFWKTVGEDSYLAQYGVDSSYIQYYRVLMDIVIPLVLINGFLQGIFAFASYITMEEKEYIQTLIYIYTVMLTLSSIMSLYFLSESLLLQSQSTVSYTVNENLVRFCKLLCLLVILGLSLLVMVTNYLRRTEVYFLAGSLILITVFCLIIVQFLFFKESIAVRETYQTQCPQQMRLTQSDWFASTCKCEKYAKDYSQTCDLQWLSQVWDISSTSQLSCLNQNCCNIMSYEYTKTYYATSFSLLGAVVFGFALTISLFQISTKITSIERKSRVVDYLFITLYIGVLVLGLILFLQNSTPKLPQQPQVLVADQQGILTVPKNKDPIVYPNNWQGVTGCQPLSKINGQAFSFVKCTPSTQTCTSADIGVRTSFLSQGASLLVTQYINKPSLMYIQQELGQQLIFPGSAPTDSFLSVQGTLEDVANFLNTKVQVCQQTTSSPTNPVLKVDIFYIPLNIPKNPSRRVLDSYQRHHVNKEKKEKIPETQHLDQPGTFTLTSAQNQYLDSLIFANLTIKVSLEGKSSKKSEVVLFRQATDCGISSSVPSRYLMTDNHGILVLHNMVSKQYFIGIRSQGYYQYCNSFTLANKKGEEYEMDVALIKKDKEKGQFTVVLQRQIVPYVKGKNVSVPPKFQMVLASTFTTPDPQATCQVGFIFPWTCGGMNFINYEQSTQAITVTDLVKAFYTFYVQFIPTDPKLQAINQMKANGGTLTAEQQNTIDNSEIWTEMAPVVTLYAQEQEGPIVRYQIPASAAQQEKNQPNLNWIVLCVDGNIGDVSQASPQQFWNYASSPTWYERSSISKAVFPTSAICQQFYNQS